MKDSLGNEGTPSTETCAYTDANTPYITTTIPQNTSSINSWLGSITVTWNANNNPAGVQYTLKRDGDITYTGTDNSYTDYGLEDNHEYCYKILATNGDDDDSSLSPEVCAITLDRTGPSIQNLTVTANNADNQCDLNWSRAGDEIRPSSENGLIGHWDFEEGSGTTTHDNSGNRLDATIHNAVFASGVHKNYALDYDGPNEDYVQTTNTLTIPDQYTLSIWIKGDLNSQKNENIYPFGWDQKVELTTNSDGSARGGILIRNAADTAYHLVWDGTNVLDNKWHHWAVTVDRNTLDVTIYLDGEEIHSTTIPDHYSGSRKINIGSWSTTYGNFDGKLDDARIYDACYPQMK
jgi:hypothetical protein